MRAFMANCYILAPKLYVYGESQNCKNFVLGDSVFIHINFFKLHIYIIFALGDPLRDAGGAASFPCQHTCWDPVQGKNQVDLQICN